MPQALALVKRELGTNAVIVHTRTFKRGGILGFGQRSLVEITARTNESNEIALGQRRVKTERLRRLYAAAQTGRINVDLPKQAPLPLTAPRSAQAGVTTDEIKNEIGGIRTLVESMVKEQRKLHAPQMPERLFDIYLDLIQREVADNIAHELIERAQENMTGNQMSSIDVVRQKLVQVMEGMINTTGPIEHNLDGSGRIVALIGPTGVGKTTTIAKLAANFKLRQNKKVGLITIDTYRIGAVDQLRMYAEIINVPLKIALTPAELTEAIALMKNEMDYIFIDTAGRCQNDELKLRELQTFLTAANPHEVHLVLSTTNHHSNMLSAAERFKELGVDHIILTKLDEAISFGVVLSVLRKIDASLSYITTGQDVPEDIEVCDRRKMAMKLLGINESIPRLRTPGEGLLA